MKPANCLTAVRLAVGLTGICLIAACQSEPTETTYSVTPQAQAYEPVGVASSLDLTQTDEPGTNQWGGVIPEAKPTTSVDDGGLGEITD
ncbi:hypothetical protein [Hyphomonas pacifica]|uniref:Uncharacterized protein n=1 Tax=Hyphomonas pacifica TaxID=1280941 RepID=A0A062TW80_9PROT|nr:hypothetical protein [Hyphomonas pacifica]KCZ50297.1 hypothetical protein HY2_14565 [Hyphomonas pacifica]RAN32784.1 hypothetical protein HY3_14140 [Hyphomonas pacifica]RAN34171.1 hypothetical protein HY11_15670 [Hyphomonas pacifica]